MSLETVLAYEAGVKDGLAQARKRDTMLDDMCNLIDERDILLAEKALLESERDALKSQNALLVDALGELLRSCPQGLECHDFHHPKKNRHEYDEPCEPLNRYMGAMAKASEVLAAVKGE